MGFSRVTTTCISSPVGMGPSSSPAPTEVGWVDCQGFSLTNAHLIARRGPWGALRNTSETYSGIPILPTHKGCFGDEGERGNMQSKLHSQSSCAFCFCSVCPSLHLHYRLKGWLRAMETRLPKFRPLNLQMSR